jgi:hypothetical protein
VRRWATALALATSLAWGAENGGLERTLTLPHELAPGAIAWLEVQVGPLAPGQRVRVTTRDGTLIGVISPFGPAARQQASVHSLPVPPQAIHGDTLSVIVTVTEGDKAPRAPTPVEVPSLKLLAPGTAR